MRQRARAIFDHALAECSIPKAFAKSLSRNDRYLYAGGNRYDLAAFTDIAAVSMGKAGHTMAEALTQIIPGAVRGIIACPVEPPAKVSGFRYYYGGHPLPNVDSLRAGTAILELLRELRDRSLAVFLISGGASAIAEKPIRPDLTLSDVIETNRTLVHSGAPIAEINAIRKHLSAIKGGRMAAAAAPATQLSLLVSDVPDHALDALASGPTMPDTTTVADCYAITGRYEMMPHFPSSVREILQQKQLLETPKTGDPVFANSCYVTALSNKIAIDAAVECARTTGFVVEVDSSCDDWDYARAADYLLDRLRTLRKTAPLVCLIFGGEVTVTVGDKPGKGGRNQQFALYCAEKIAGEAVTVLSAGTDGIDGNSSAAGALVDGTTLARAAQRGLNSADALSHFDAFPFLDAIGDTLIIGPTGNNVRDLRVLLAY